MSRIMKQQIAKGSHILYFHMQNQTERLAAQPLTAEKLVERFVKAASLPLVRFSACVQRQPASVGMTICYFVSHGDKEQSHVHETCIAVIVMRAMTAMSQ